MYHKFTTTFICDDQPDVKVLITCSFQYSFEEKEGMAYFKFLEALFSGISFAIVDIVPIAAPASISYLGKGEKAARILGADDHLKIMNSLRDNILKAVQDGK